MMWTILRCRGRFIFSFVMIKKLPISYAQFLPIKNFKSGIICVIILYLSINQYLHFIYQFVFSSNANHNDNYSWWEYIL